MSLQISKAVAANATLFTCERDYLDGAGVDKISERMVHGDSRALIGWNATIRRGKSCDLHEKYSIRVRILPDSLHAVLPLSRNLEF